MKNNVFICHAAHLDAVSDIIQRVYKSHITILAITNLDSGDDYFLCQYEITTNPEEPPISK